MSADVPTRDLIIGDGGAADSPAFFCQGQIGLAFSIDEAAQTLELESEYIENNESFHSVIPYDIEAIRSGSAQALAAIADGQQGYYSALHADLQELQDEHISAKEFLRRFSSWKNEEDPLFRAIARIGSTIDSWRSRAMGIDPKEYALESLGAQMRDGEVHRFMLDFFRRMDALLQEAPDNRLPELRRARNGISHICGKIEALRDTALKVAALSKMLLENNYPQSNIELVIDTKWLAPILHRTDKLLQR